jgi:hypothetical protein
LAAHPRGRRKEDGTTGSAAALPGLWVGFEAVNEIQRFESEISSQEVQTGVRISKEKADRRIAECRQGIEGKTTERNLAFGGAAAALVVGLTTALLPWSGKRKAPAEPAPAPAPAPAPDQDAPGA